MLKVLLMLLLLSACSYSDDTERVYLFSRLNSEEQDKLVLETSYKLWRKNCEDIGNTFTIAKTNLEETYILANENKTSKKKILKELKKRVYAPPIVYNTTYVENGIADSYCRQEMFSYFEVDGEKVHYYAYKQIKRDQDKSNPARYYKSWYDFIFDYLDKDPNLYDRYRTTFIGMDKIYDHIKSLYKSGIGDETILLFGDYVDRVKK